MGNLPKSLLLGATILSLAAAMIAFYPHDFSVGAYDLYLSLRKSHLSDWTERQEKQLFSQASFEQDRKYFQEFDRAQQQLNKIDVFSSYPLNSDAPQRNLETIFSAPFWKFSKSEQRELREWNRENWLNYLGNFKNYSVRTKFFDEIFRFTYWNHEFSTNLDPRELPLEAEAVLTLAKIHLSQAEDARVATENLMQVMHLAHLAYSTESKIGIYLALTLLQVSEEFSRYWNTNKKEKLSWNSPLQGQSLVSLAQAMNSWNKILKFPLDHDVYKQFARKSSKYIAMCAAVREIDIVLMTLWREHYPGYYDQQVDLLSHAEANCRTIAEWREKWSRKRIVEMAVNQEIILAQDHFLFWTFAPPVDVANLESSSYDQVNLRKLLGHMRYEQNPSPKISTSEDFAPDAISARLPASADRQQK